MENQTITSKRSSRRQTESPIRGAANADREKVEALPVTDTLWRQIDRWVNEGGAVDDGIALSAL